MTSKKFKNPFMLWQPIGTLLLLLFSKNFVFLKWKIRVIFPQKSFECVQTIFFQVAKSKHLPKLKTMV
jgi:hypothetical protein